MSITTTKQFGDACEMLVMVHIHFAGVPVSKMPDNWPVYDCIVQPNARPESLTVKGRHTDPARAGEAYKQFFRFDGSGWDWLALVLVADGTAPRTWIIPHGVAIAVSSAMADGTRRLPFGKLETPDLAGFEDNFALRSTIAREV